MLLCQFCSIAFKLTSNFNPEANLTLKASVPYLSIDWHSTLETQIKTQRTLLENLLADGTKPSSNIKATFGTLRNLSTRLDDITRDWRTCDQNVAIARMNGENTGNRIFFGPTALTHKPPNLEESQERLTLLQTQQSILEDMVNLGKILAELMSEFGKIKEDARHIDNWLDESGFSNDLAEVHTQLFGLMETWHQLKSLFDGHSGFSQVEKENFEPKRWLIVVSHIRGQFKKMNKKLNSFVVRRGSFSNPLRILGEQQQIFCPTCHIEQQQDQPCFKWKQR